MRIFFHGIWMLVFAALAFSAMAHGEDVNALIAQAKAAEARFDSAAALQLFLKADAAKPNDPYILQKLARQCSDAANDVADLEERKRLCLQALDYSQRATALDSKDAVNVLSIAICYGKLALLTDSVRTKIEYSRKMIDYAQQAVALDPNYDYAHHIIGRWNYEVASLGAGTRFVVRLVYGGLPPASTAEAVRQLTRATELSPTLPSHRVELGFALLADGQRDAARKTFEQALAMKPVEKYDQEAFRRAREALAKLH